MVSAIKAQPGAWHRAWSLALLDEGRERDAVLAQARRDLEDRQDVYALGPLCVGAAPHR